MGVAEEGEDTDDGYILLHSTYRANFLTSANTYGERERVEIAI